MRRQRALMVDGVDTLLAEPTSTSGQPDGWGWDVWRWRALRSHLTRARA